MNLSNPNSDNIAKLISQGINIIDPSSVYIDDDVYFDDNVTIYPMVVLCGHTVIDKNAVIYSFCDLTDTTVGEGTEMRSVFAVGAKIGSHCTVGPFATLRKGAVIGDRCRVGDYVEIKNSILGTGVKAAHLAYVGDSLVGERTNIGCGTVFANYNGKVKQRVEVGSDVFIGCNTNLIAPLCISDGAYIAAGSTVTKDIPKNGFCVARAREYIKLNRENR